MAKLQGRIPSVQVEKSETWSLPFIGLDENSGSKIFRLKSSFGGNQKSSSPVRGGKASKANVPLDRVGTSSADSTSSADDISSSSDTGPADGTVVTTTPTKVEVMPTKTEQEDPVLPVEGVLPAEDALPVEPANNALPTDGASSEVSKETLDIESKGYLAGEAKGFQAGESAGREQGLRDVRVELENSFSHEMKDKRALMTNLLAAFETPPDRKEEIESSLISLISQVAEVVILSELKANPELIGRLVNHAMDALPHGTTNLKVQVNPANIEFLRSEMSDLNIEYIPNRNLSIGSCQIQSDASTVDATLAKRIHDSLIKVFSSEAVEDISESTLLDLEEEIDSEC